MLQIEYYRRVAGLTQFQLADAVDITQPKISQLEKGKIKISEVTLERIAERIKYPKDAPLWDLLKECPERLNVRKN